MRFFVLASLLCVTSAASAFINIEALRRSQKEGFTGSLNLQANGQTGNTNKFVNDLSSLNMFRDQDKEYLFLANYKYGESGSIRDVNQGSLHLRAAQGWTNFPMTEIFYQSQFDQFKLLKVRDLVGAGLRFRRGGSYLGTGLFHEWEQIDLPNENQQDWRGNFYFSHLVDFASGWQGSVILYYQPAFDHADDARLRADLGLESMITERLSLTLKYSHQYDSEPPSTVARNDTSYLAGISFKY